MQGSILALLAGKAVPLANGEASAIAKAPVQGRVKITWIGIPGDEQADRRYHGGPDKALHLYPSEHYAHWATLALDHPLLNAPGAFGENLSTSGLTETQVCIGDRFRCGTALLEISQGREPCWKQAARMQWTTLPKMMVRERRSGWYFRVIEEGEAGEGDEMVLVDRPLPDWTVARVFGLLIAGDWKNDLQALSDLVAMEQLFEGWRLHAHDLLAQVQV